MEMHPSDYTAHFGLPGFFGTAPRAHESLEVITEIQYCRKYPGTVLEPVDLPTPEAEFFGNYEALCGLVERLSLEFNRLEDEITRGRKEEGFPFLNSERYATLSAKSDAAMLSAIQPLDDPQPLKIYEAWADRKEAREIEMLKNIREYCASNAFERGVFLVGAAHRQPIIDRLGEERCTTIQWDFTAFLGA